LEYAIKKLRDAAEATEQEFEDMTRQCVEKQEILDGLIKELAETKETLDDSNKKAGDLLLQLARARPEIRTDTGKRVQRASVITSIATKSSKL
jgi:hypothetical protein